MITVATLADHGMVERWVAAFEGRLSEEERRTLAARFGAVYGWDGSSEEEDEPSREMYFREVDVLTPSSKDILFLNEDDNDPCVSPSKG